MAHLGKTPAHKLEVLSSGIPITVLKPASTASMCDADAPGVRWEWSQDPWEPEGQGLCCMTDT